MEYRVQIVRSIRVVESIDEYIRADNEWYIVFEEEKLFHPWSVDRGIEPPRIAAGRQRGFLDGEVIHSDAWWVASKNRGSVVEKHRINAVAWIHASVWQA